MTRVIIDNNEIFKHVRELGINVSKEYIDSLIKETISDYDDDIDLSKLHPLTRIFYKLAQVKESTQI